MLLLLGRRLFPCSCKLAFAGLSHLLPLLVRRNSGFGSLHFQLKMKIEQVSVEDRMPPAHKDEETDSRCPCLDGAKRVIGMQDGDMLFPHSVNTIFSSVYGSVGNIPTIANLSPCSRSSSFSRTKSSNALRSLLISLPPTKGRYVTSNPSAWKRLIRCELKVGVSDTKIRWRRIHSSAMRLWRRLDELVLVLRRGCGCSLSVVLVAVTVGEALELELGAPRWVRRLNNFIF